MDTTSLFVLAVAAEGHSGVAGNSRVVVVAKIVVAVAVGCLFFVFFLVAEHSAVAGDSRVVAPVATVVVDELVLLEQPRWFLLHNPCTGIGLYLRVANSFL